MAEKFLLRELPHYDSLQERAVRYPDLDVGAVEATLSLLRVAGDVLEGMGAHLARQGISQGRFLVLILLSRRCAEAGMSPSDLAQCLDVSRANITGLLDGLEKDGFVRRRQHPEDRRALTIHLTVAGHDFLEAMLPEHYRRIAGLMVHLAPDERRELTQLLGKVARGVGALRDQEWTPELEFASELI